MYANEYEEAFRKVTGSDSKVADDFRSGVHVNDWREVRLGFARMLACHRSDLRGAQPLAENQEEIQLILDLADSALLEGRTSGDVPMLEESRVANEAEVAYRVASALARLLKCATDALPTLPQPLPAKRTDAVEPAVLEGPRAGHVEGKGRGPAPNPRRASRGKRQGS